MVGTHTICPALNSCSKWRKPNETTSCPLPKPSLAFNRSYVPGLLDLHVHYPRHLQWRKQILRGKLLMPKQTLILDSSQLSTLLECEERWRLEQQENLIHINEKFPAESNRPNEAIAAGSLGHKYQEIYYHELAIDRKSVGEG